MYKLVPQLRFPEFFNDPEWKLSTIGEIAKIFSGGTPATGRKDYYGGDIPFIRSAEINRDRTELFLTKEGLKNSSSKMVEIGDVLYALYGANSGDVAISKLNGAINQAILCIRTDGRNELVYQFLTHKKEAILSSYLQGGQGNLSGEIVKSIKIPFPQNSKEQQKIAKCLSSLDDLVKAQIEKVANLKAVKKGLLQQLFPQDGETVPRLRFPKFRNDGDWEVKTLREVCHLQAGKFVAASAISVLRSNESYPCFGGNGLRGYTKTFTHEGNYSLIGRQGALCGNITFAHGKFHATEHAVVATPHRGISNDWLYYILGHLNLNQYATGQAQPGLSVERLDSVKLNVPESIKEQQRIADCLLSLDEFIRNQSEKVESLKTHKRGLLQQLFPTLPEAVDE